MKDSHREAAKTVAKVVAFIAIFGAFFVMSVHPYGDMVHDYDVKAEQVTYGDDIENDTDYSNLTADEETALQKAFKKSDHFLGGAEVTITTDELINTSDGWKVVRIHGVPLLVSIDGPETYRQLTLMNFVGGVCAFLQLLFTWMWVTSPSAHRM